MKLTEYSRASGCGCKIAPEDLQKILGSCGFESNSEKLIVGNDSCDDAAVYDLGNGRALISTTDFFMPMVNDPYIFGQIAASNALSDVFAMGGKPILALAILGWPMELIPLSAAAEVMRGAKDTCKKFGVPIAGGHSVNSKEPFFGLAVNGEIELVNLKRNNTLSSELKIAITKPLGLGIGTSMLRREMLSSAEMNELHEHMVKVNSIGEQLGKLEFVRSMTDITGFGLLGHLKEMATNFPGSIEIEYSSIPLASFARRGASQFIFPDNTTKNFNFVKENVSALTGEQMLVLCDPQTSGGLLFTFDENEETKVLELFHEQQEQLYIIGKTTQKKEHEIQIV
jgi:selenide, water dikinase